jgi:hypothetical protein
VFDALYRPARRRARDARATLTARASSRARARHLATGRCAADASERNLVDARRAFETASAARGASERDEARARDARDDGERRASEDEGRRGMTTRDEVDSGTALQ